MNRIGIITISSNVIRITLAEISDSKHFKIIDELKERTKMDFYLVNSSNIKKEDMKFILSTVRSFMSMCVSSGTNKIILVCTGDISRAKNINVLKEKILKELNINMQILNSEKEIYYNFLGTANSMECNNSLLIDINSNITYLAWIFNNSIYKKCVLPFGYVTLTSLFNLDDTISFSDSTNSLSYIRNALNNLDLTWLKENKFDLAIGIGGAFRNIGKIHRRKNRYPLELSHNYILSSHDIDEIFCLLKSKNLKQRMSIDGLSKTRGNTIVSATQILKEILNVSMINNISVCGSSLREGILYDYLNKLYTSKEEILDSSLQNVMDDLNINKLHSKNVYKISSKLFEELQSLHKLDNSYKYILKTASLLHDCGINIRYYDHHLHSLYIILNSQINGLTHKEKLLSALCAASHRNNNFEVPLPKYGALINKLDIYNIEKLGVLLKISESLDRNLVGSIFDIKIKIDDNAVNIGLFSFNHIDLEIKQALRSAQIFKDIYGKNLNIFKVNDDKIQKI
ncbi:MAG: Ppx/GppA phosphatase family protein [Clostridium perfringens]|nr:Ppx/GppA phosphatase family protein [Clostridium perfringens]